MSERTQSPQQLKRSFGMRESVTITVGQVIGVGLFVTGAIVSSLLWSALGMVLYALYHNRQANREPTPVLDRTPPVDPSPEERSQMDREYRLWRTIVLVATVAAVLLYFLPVLS